MIFDLHFGTFVPKCKILRMILIYILELLFQNVNFFPDWKRKKFQNVNFFPDWKRKKFQNVNFFPDWKRKKFQNVNFFPDWKKKKFQNVKISQEKVPKCKNFPGKSSKM